MRTEPIRELDPNDPLILQVDALRTAWSEAATQHEGPTVTWKSISPTAVRRRFWHATAGLRADLSFRVGLRRSEVYLYPLLQENKDGPYVVYAWDLFVDGTRKNWSYNATTPWDALLSLKAAAAADEHPTADFLASAWSMFKEKMNPADEDEDEPDEDEPDECDECDPLVEVHNALVWAFDAAVAGPEAAGLSIQIEHEADDPEHETDVTLEVSDRPKGYIPLHSATVRLCSHDDDGELTWSIRGSGALEGSDFCEYDYPDWRSALQDAVGYLDHNNEAERALVRILESALDPTQQQQQQQQKQQQQQQPEPQARAQEQPVFDKNKAYLDAWIATAKLYATLANEHLKFDSGMYTGAGVPGSVRVSFPDRQELLVELGHLQVVDKYTAKVHCRGRPVYALTCGSWPDAGAAALRQVLVILGENSKRWGPPGPRDCALRDFLQQVEAQYMEWCGQAVHNGAKLQTVQTLIPVPVPVPEPKPIPTHVAPVTNDKDDDMATKTPDNTPVTTLDQTARGSVANFFSDAAGAALTGAKQGVAYQGGKQLVTLFSALPGLSVLGDLPEDIGVAVASLLAIGVGQLEFSGSEYARQGGQLALTAAMANRISSFDIPQIGSQLVRICRGISGKDPLPEAGSNDRLDRIEAALVEIAKTQANAKGIPTV